ncbi:MAG: EFR1 family ferrodoxin [Bacteroidota bacterium]
MQTEIRANKLLIYYFSGTGNARNVARWCSDFASGKGWEVSVVDLATIDRYSIAVPPDGTMIGFCSPTHGFNLPPVVLKFFRHFPRGNRNPVWIVNTRAGSKLWKIFLPGLTGIGQIWAALFLRLKNYRVRGMRPIDLPSNWISLHPGYRKKVVASMTAKCYRISIRFIDRMITGRKDFRALYDMVQDLLIAPVSIAYYFIGRFFLAKTYIASRDCNNCGICIKNCPVGAIRTVRGRPYWTLKCESCMRCMNHCPERAIETPHGFLAASLYLVFTVGMEWLYFFTTDRIGNETFRAVMDNGTVRFTVGSALAIPFLLLAYHLLHLLMGLPLTERLFTFTSLTHFRFWRRYRASRNFTDNNNFIHD